VLTVTPACGLFTTTLNPEMEVAPFRSPMMFTVVSIDAVPEHALSNVAFAQLLAAPGYKGA
jgi:hypothetical protein